MVAVETYRPAPGVAGRRSPYSVPLRGIDVQIAEKSGAFIINGLAPGQYVLTASAPARPPAHTETIGVVAGQRVSGVSIVLAAGGTLQGQVLDQESNQPIAGARVALDLVTLTRANGVGAARTDVDGRYRLNGAPGRAFSLRVSAAGYRTRIVAGLAAQAEVVTELDISLVGLTDGGKAQTEYTGIGAGLGNSPKGVIVGWLLDSGPAASAGVRRGDVIVRIDGMAAEGMSIAECVQLLRGPAESRVAVTLLRDSELLDVVITRAPFVR